MHAFKDFINFLSDPRLTFSALAIGIFFVFPPTDWFEKWNKKLRIPALWTTKGAVWVFALITLLFTIGLADENCSLILTKPDNVPIAGLVFLTYFFLWLAMKQAVENDAKLEAGMKPTDIHDPKDKVLVWPDLVYVEFISLILCTAFLIVWSIFLAAPVEEPANLTLSPNPAKAPWYFLGLQELLVYFDPWIAGVVLPSIVLGGIAAIPYIDNNEKGIGYYSFKQRRFAISLFMFGWLILWVYLIFIGTFLRGPNWNFFGPFEAWDLHKLEALTNVNLSEYIYMKWIGVGLPQNIIVREMWGILLVGGYFAVLPPLLAVVDKVRLPIFGEVTLGMKKIYQSLGPIRYSAFIVMLLWAILIPIKMYLRWTVNLKYLVAIPEYFFNI